MFTATQLSVACRPTAAAACKLASQLRICAHPAGSCAAQPHDQQNRWLHASQATLSARPLRAASAANLRS